MTNELREKIFKQGKHNEGYYGGCAQCVLLTLSQTVMEIDPIVIRSATALMGGGVRMGNSCGAFNGGLMAISYITGRNPDNMDDKDAVTNTVTPARELYYRFMENYHSVLCRGIHKKLFGRTFDMSTPEGVQEFIDAGGHDGYCDDLVGTTSVWVAEILEKYGYLDLSDK